MKNITRPIMVTPGMPFKIIAAQVMAEATTEFLATRSATMQTGKELGYSEAEINEGIDKFLLELSEKIKESGAEVNCSFEHFHINSKEKAPTESANSNVGAHSNNQEQSTSDSKVCQERGSAQKEK
ncbi:MAG: hypothetical protein ACK5MV_13535 [Aminipila sp.]